MSLRRNFTLFCEEYGRIRDITHLPRHTVLFPITLVTLSTTFFQIILKPFGQDAFVSQMLAGIALGPSFLGQNGKWNKKIYSPRTMLMLNLLEAFGLVYMFFTNSVRMDINIIKKSGRLGIFIGVASCVFPFMATSFTVFMLTNIFGYDEKLLLSLQTVVEVESSISFHVILSLLTDLKLLNSELGRLALSSSLINTLVTTCYRMFLRYLNVLQSDEVKNGFLLWNLTIAALIIIAVFVVRPTLYWMMNQTPEEKYLKHEHVVAIHIIVLLCTFYSQFTGVIGYTIAVILGLVTPVNPPMGSRLVDTMQHLVWSAFLPCFILNMGRRVNLLSIGLKDFLSVELLILVNTSVKTCAILIPSLYYKMPFLDALSLCLVLNYRGIYDVQIFSRSNQRLRLTDEGFSILTITAVLKSAIALPLLRVTYDSSRRYIAYSRRTIQHNVCNAELRILACIPERTDVQTIINFLQVSNPPHSPVGLYVLNMKEYVGSSLPLIITHRFDKTPSSQPTKVDLMVDAFRKYEQQNSKFVSVQCFTAIAPRASMHDDICSMAFEKSTSLVIIPFQGLNSSFLKKMIKNVLEMAPCSVGLLFDRGVFMDSRPIFTRRLKINVCVLFVGGADDREALAYGARMAEDCNIMLRIIRFCSVNQTINDLIEEKYDQDTINDIRINTMGNENVNYIKHSVKEGSETAHVVHSVGKDSDLILVGRRHEIDSPVLSGLLEWSEIEEMGVLGDLLISTDFRSNASVMVIQQQASVVEEMIGSPKYISKELK